MHGDNWVIELAIVREHGVALLGPRPASLIKPITADRVRQAARAELTLRACEWSSSSAPGWLQYRHHQAFVVETVCRALYTLQYGGLPTKPQAVRWAMSALTGSQRELVAESQRWRADHGIDTYNRRRVVELLEWASAL